MPPYEQASYAEVLRWLENTEIEYTPNGKRPGTKSYDRYEKYSQAKTVVEALDLGSKPLDLVHDYQKKLLKRVGGPIRDRPLKMAEVEDTTKLTKTDLILARWGFYLDNQDADNAKDGDEKDLMTRRKMEQRDAFRKAKVATKSHASGVGVRKDAKQALAGLKSLQSKKNPMMSKILAMRAGGTTGSGPAVGGASVNSPMQPEGDAERKRVLTPLASKGLLARVLAKRTQGQGALMKAENRETNSGSTLSRPVADSPPAKRGIKKLGAVGGLLARVQKRAQGRDESPEMDAVSTPPSKRSRTDSVADCDTPDASVRPREQTCLTEGMPSSLVKVCDSRLVGLEKEVPTQVEVVLPAPDPHCHHFLRLAEVLVTGGDLVESSRAIGEHLRTIAQSVSSPEATLRAAMFFLDPAAVVPDRIISSSLAEAYSLTSAPSSKGEALVAQVLTEFQSKQTSEAPADTEGGDSMQISDAPSLANDDVADAPAAGSVETENEKGMETSEDPGPLTTEAATTVLVEAEEETGMQTSEASAPLAALNADDLTSVHVAAADEDMGTLEAPPVDTVDTAAAPAAPAASAETEDEQAMQISEAPPEDTAGPAPAQVKTEEQQDMQISDLSPPVTDEGIAGVASEAPTEVEVGQALQTSEALAPLTSSDVAATAPSAPDLQDAQSMPISEATPLTILDVASAALAARAEAVDEPELASSRLAKLFNNAQSGKEASLLVRSLQGKLAPTKEIMQRAVALAVLPRKLPPVSVPMQRAVAMAV